MSSGQKGLIDRLILEPSGLLICSEKALWIMLGVLRLPDVSARVRQVTSLRMTGLMSADSEV